MATCAEVGVGVFGRSSSPVDSQPHSQEKVKIVVFCYLANTAELASPSPPVLADSRCEEPTLRERRHRNASRRNYGSGGGI